MTMAGEAGKTAPIPVKKTTTPDAKAGEKAGGSPHASPSHSAHRPSMGGGMKKKVETYAMPDKPKKPGEGAFGSAGFGTIHGMFPEDPARMIVRVGARGHGMSNCDGPRHALAGLVHGAHQEPDGDEGIPESRLLNGGDGDGDEIGPLARKGHGFGFKHGMAIGAHIGPARARAAQATEDANMHQNYAAHRAASDAHQDAEYEIRQELRNNTTLTMAERLEMERAKEHHANSDYNHNNARMMIPVNGQSRTANPNDRGATAPVAGPGRTVAERNAPMPVATNPETYAQQDARGRLAAKEKRAGKAARKAAPPSPGGKARKAPR